jgi:hypothetical protein
MVADITIMAWLYGENYDQFLPRWQEAIKNLNTKPKKIMIISDRKREIDLAEVIVIEPRPEWNTPNPHYANYVARNTSTKWLLLMDIDDMIKPDALDDLETVEADIYLMGIDINGNEIYLPPRLSNEQIATLPACYFCFGSPIKRDLVLKFPFHDTPYGDWIFWREAARSGAKFEWSNRVGYYYRKDFANSMSGWADANPKWREEALRS